MPPPLFIALRFILSRRKAMLLSLSGVVLGVGFYICMQAQTHGFEKFFVDALLGSSGAVVVQERFQTRFTGIINEPGAVVSVSSQQPRKYYEGVNNPDQVMRVVQQFSNVAACTPVLEGNATVRNDFQQDITRLQGIDLDSFLKATLLRTQIVEGDLADFRAKPAGLIIGIDLAHKLGIKTGQVVALAGADGANESFHVSAIFQTGIGIIDERRVFIHLPVAQNLLRKPGTVSHILITLHDPSRAPQFAAHLERLLQHRARSWQEREHGNLQIFRALRISAAITVSTVILLAGFGTFNVLTMMVLDKVREIAVLRSMGYRRADISAVFLWQGLLIAVIGSITGCALGALLTFIFSKIPLHMRGLLSVDTFLVAWSAADYVAASLIAFVAIFLATYFPSRRAAQLAPVTILRGSGQ